MVRGEVYTRVSFFGELLQKTKSLFALVFLLSTCICAQAQYNVHSVTADGWYYSYSYLDYPDCQVTIEGYRGTSSAISIPNTIYEMPVRGIGEYAFYMSPNLVEVTIPQNITNIEDGAFYGCPNLTRVIGGNNIANINDYAFYWCPKLSDITIPSSVRNIGTSAFSVCFGLKNIEIPDGVTSIGDSAFSGCPLTNIVIPDSVIKIGNLAFYGCPAISITVDEKNPFYSSRDGVLFNKDQTVLIQYPNKKLGSSYTVPDSAATIESHAFYRSEGLKNIIIPKSVLSIGSDAFMFCSNLETITVDVLNPNYSSNIDGVLFNKNQTTLIYYPGGKSGGYIIPNSVTCIGSCSFYYCTGLISIVIDNNVESIKDWAFFGCNKLTDVTIGNSVSNIEAWAFSDCNLLKNIIIPASIRNINECVFNGCSSLESVVLMGNAPSMGSDVFFNIPTNPILYYFDASTGFTSPGWNDYSTVNMGAFSSVKPWLISKGLPYNTDLHSSPACDGIPLLMKYALKLDPNRNESGNMPQPIDLGDRISLTYYAGSEGVTYTVEASADLQTWSIEGITISGPDANSNYTASISKTGPKRFLRLVVTH